MTYKEVAEIVKLIDASNCDELVVEVAGAKIVVRRNGRATEPHRETSAAPALQTSAVKPAPGPALAAPKATAGARGDGTVEIRAPMVGTFYRAPSPKDPPFVEIGSTVKPGDTVCLIEVMKLYTTIRAERAGRIVEILPANAQLVEYDQVLFVIEPS